MTQVIGTFRVGEDIGIALDIASGTAPGGVVVTASMKRGRLLGETFEPLAGADPVAITVTSRAESGDIPAGWNLTLPAAASALLAAGTYGIDAKFAVSGGATEITDMTAVIRLTRAVIA